MPLPLSTQYVEDPQKWSALTEDEKHFWFYAQLHGEITQIRRNLVNHNRVVDEWASEPLGDSLTVATGQTTQLKPPRAWHSDVVITSITAMWPTASTSAVIQLGDRVLTLPPALGYINMNGLRIQLEYEDDRFFTIAPAGACFIHLAGYADEARPGNRGGQRG